MEFMIILLVIILLSFLTSKLFEFMKIPRVMAPLFVGIFLGFYRDSLVSYYEMLEILSNLGIIMLLFYTGLELNIKGFKKVGKETFLVALFGVLFSFGLGFLASYYLLQFSFIISFVIAASLSITAQGVMAIILDEKNMINSKVGEIILGAGIIDDIFGILLLFVVSFLVNLETFSLQILKPFLIGAIFVFLFFKFFNLIKKFLGNIFLEEKKEHFYDVFTLSLIVVFGIAGSLTFIGFDFSIGAILAGILLNISLSSRGKEGRDEEHVLDKFIKAISFGFLNYFFFFWVGFNIDLNSILNNPYLGIFLCIIGFTGKFLAGLTASYLSSDKLKNGVLIGVGMVTKGGVGLIIAEVAKKSGLITNETFSAIVLMGVVLTIIPPIIFNVLVNNSIKHKNFLK